MRENLSRSLDNYKRGATSIRIITEGQLGIKLPDETINTWQNLFVAMRLVDNQIDSEPDQSKRLRYSQSILEYLADKGSLSESFDSDLVDCAQKVKQDIAQLTEAKRVTFTNSLSTLFKVTEKIRSSTDIEEVSNLCRLEGQLTWRILQPFLPDDIFSGDQRRDHNKFITRLGRAGNIVDTFIDFPDDYNNGELQVPPTALNRLKLLGSGVGDGLYLSSHMMGDTLVEVARSTVNTLQNNLNKN